MLGVKDNWLKPDRPSIMDELQGEKKDKAQDSVDELLISSACVDHFATIDSPQPIVNGMQHLLVEVIYLM